MAKSSISADVKAANSKLAQFLRRKEEEEMLLQIGKRKPKQQRDDKRLPEGRARWAAEPDFKVPTCLIDRPRTASGSTSFHFSYISISKEALPTIGDKPLPGSFGKLREPALEHSKYIERDGAAEVTGLSAGAQHAGYIERPGAIETLDPSGLIEEAIERQIASVLNETPTEEEASILGLREAAPEGIPSVFSNISADAFERQEFWRAVERCERKPRTNYLILDPEASPRWWDAMLASPRIDPSFKNHALNVAETFRQHVETPSINDAPTKPFEAEPYPVSAERAGKLIQQAMALPGFDHSLPPLEFKSGRGGRVQIRFVAQLPHEISAEDRALIVQNFVERLGNLETRIDDDHVPRKVGMMYTAVIHAPDAHNDSRNYHLHIVAYDRPATFRHDFGMWDFEFAEHYQIKGMDRVRYPFRQNKIGEVARPGNGADYERAGKNFIPAMRKEFAEIVNAVLKARGIERRYDHRRYTEMGIDRTPTEHLGTKAAALEAIGVPTTVGQLNAIAIWSDAERSIESQAKKREAKLKSDQSSLRTLEDRAYYYDSPNPLIPRLRSLITERSAIIKGLAEDRRSIMAFDTMEAKAKSRAMRTRQTCVRLLADIENGDADRTTRVMKFAIEARWKDAQKHIEAIDAALAPHRSALAEAAAEIERRERRLKEIDAALRPIRTQLEEAIYKEEYNPLRPRHDPTDILNARAADAYIVRTPVNAQETSELEPKGPQVNPHRDKLEVEPGKATGANKERPTAPAQPRDVARDVRAPNASVSKEVETQTAINAKKQSPAIEPILADKQKEAGPSERQPSASNHGKLENEKPETHQPAEQPVSVTAERSAPTEIGAIEEPHPAAVSERAEPETREAFDPHDEAAPTFESSDLQVASPAEDIASEPQSLAQVVNEAELDVREAPLSPERPKSNHVKCVPPAENCRGERKNPTAANETTGPDEPETIVSHGELHAPSESQVVPPARLAERTRTEPLSKELTTEPSEIPEPSAEIKADKASAILKPVTLDGIPIVKRTISPVPCDENEVSAKGQDTIPEGLNPLRREEVPSFDEENEIRLFKDEIENSCQAEATDLPPGSRSTSPVNEPNSASFEDQLLSKMDRQKAELETWEALITKIQNDRIPIENMRNGEASYDVPALGPEEQTLLHGKRLARRTQARLKGIYEIQKNEIRRLGCWIKEDGKDPQKLKINETGIIVQNAPAAVQSLFQNWHRHPEIREHITAENNRRLAIARQKAKPLETATDTSLDNWIYNAYIHQRGGMGR